MSVIDDLNYYADRRVQAMGDDGPFKGINPSNRTAVVTVLNYDTEEYEDVIVPIKFEVCDMCSGSGITTNPSVDAGGLSREDFDDDPDFAHEYFSGRYDIQCPQCHGERVYPDFNRENQPEDVIATIDRVEEALNQKARDDAEYHADRMAEIRAGC